MDEVTKNMLRSEQLFYEAARHATEFRPKRIRSLAVPFPKRYRYRWEEKDGKRRPLSIPSRALRMVQDFLQREILQFLDIHDAAHGYRKARSTVSALTPHINPEILVCLDAQAFFSSITEEAVKQRLLEHGALERLATLIAALCTDKGMLPQGTPTSPSLSNTVGFPLDNACASTAKEYGYIYTRFVDDLVFTCKENRDRDDVDRFLDDVCNHIRGLGYGIQTKKFKVAKGFQNQEVLGLVLNKSGDGLPLRVTRKFKRRLRAALHQIETRGEAEWNETQVQSARAYIEMVEGKDG